MSLDIDNVIKSRRATLANKVHASLQTPAPRWKPIQPTYIHSGYIKKKQALLLQNLIRKQGDSYDIDVAHVDNSLLPENLQEENNAAAESTITFIVEALNGGRDLDNPSLVFEVAEDIHRAWLGRRLILNNGQMPQWIVDQKQNLPLSQLSRERQQWYCSIAEEGIKLVKEYISSRPN